MSNLLNRVCMMAITIASISVFSTSALANTCAEYTGSALNFCTSYCEDLDCDNPASTADANKCSHFKGKFMDRTGEAYMPCDCPCWDNGVSDLNDLFLPLAPDEHYVSCVSNLQYGSSIMVWNNQNEPQRQVFERIFDGNQVSL